MSNDPLHTWTNNYNQLFYGEPECKIEPNLFTQNALGKKKSGRSVLKNRATLIIQKASCMEAFLFYK